VPEIYGILLRFSQVLPGFLTNQNFSSAFALPAPTPLLRTPPSY